MGAGVGEGWGRGNVQGWGWRWRRGLGCRQVSGGCGGGHEAVPLWHGTQCVVAGHRSDMCMEWHDVYRCILEQASRRDMKTQAWPALPHQEADHAASHIPLPAPLLRADRTSGSEAVNDLAIFHRAGINTLDTADNYGPSEALVGGGGAWVLASEALHGR